MLLPALLFGTSVFAAPLLVADLLLPLTLNQIVLYLNPFCVLTILGAAVYKAHFTLKSPLHSAIVRPKSYFFTTLILCLIFSAGIPSMAIIIDPELLKSIGPKIPLTILFDMIIAVAYLFYIAAVETMILRSCFKARI